MNCSKHPKYNGLRYKKIRCETCDLIHKEVQKSRQFGGLKSLTTADWSFGLGAFLAELSCVMRFGKLPPFFWRQDSQVPQFVKDHYHSVYKVLKSWNYRDPDTFKKVGRVFSYIYTQFAAKDRADKIGHKIVEILSKDVEEQKAPAPVVDIGANEAKKINPWEMLDE